MTENKINLIVKYKNMDKITNSFIIGLEKNDIDVETIIYEKLIGGKEINNKEPIIVDYRISKTEMLQIPEYQTIKDRIIESSENLVIYNIIDNILEKKDNNVIKDNLNFHLFGYSDGTFYHQIVGHIKEKYTKTFEEHKDYDLSKILKNDIVIIFNKISNEKKQHNNELKGLYKKHNGKVLIIDLSGSSVLKEDNKDNIYDASEINHLIITELKKLIKLIKIDF